MKMGIERVLKENFPHLKEVLSVAEEEKPSLLSRDAIEAALAKIGPAIRALKGRVEIAAVEGATGEVRVNFSGPAKLRQGVELVIRDIPLVKEVVIIESETETEAVASSASSSSAPAAQ